MHKALVRWARHLSNANVWAPGRLLTRTQKIFSLGACLPVLLAAAVFSAPAMATDVWTVTPAGPGPLNGTLGDTTVSLASSTASLFSQSGNKGTYRIWDNDAPANSAKIWPATAKPYDEFVIVAAPTASNLTVTFGRPLVNPQMLVYSLDNSTIDFSTTKAVGGAPAILTIVKNPGATYDPLTKVLGTLGFSAIPEGCSDTETRGCAVVTFIGTYSQLDMVVQSTNPLTTDGIGMQFGVDPAIEASMRPVPTLSEWGLALMALLLATVAGGLAHRRLRPTR